MKVEEVGIIGTGSIGLCAIHWCLKRGLKPVAFEKNEHVGGVWHQEDPPCHSAAYDSLFTNSSNSLMNLSDYPFPFKTSSEFPNHKEICRYYNGYMENYSLEQFINFNTTVTRVWKDDKKWIVETQSGESHVFDAIMCCSGRLWDPVFPDWAQTVKEPIDICHSHDYRNPERFIGKNVLVIGVGNSALDISLELAQDPRVQSVMVSCRRGTTIIPTRDSKGHANDKMLNSRAFQHWLSPQLRALIFGSLVQKVNLKMRKYGLPEPDGGLGSPRSPFSNLKQTTEYLEALEKGLISFHTGVHKIICDDKVVLLNNGASLSVDAIICCTGYKGSVDYLDDTIHKDIFQTLTVVNRKHEKRNLKWVKLYHQMVYTKDPTLCCLGMLTTIGNETCVGEMQARWCTAMWCDQLKGASPTNEDMEKECERNRNKVLKIQPPVTEFVRYVHYMDELAEELGCMPRLQVMKMIVNPSKWRWLYRLIFGPVYPIQYRLNGPDKLPNAENILLSLL